MIQIIKRKRFHWLSETINTNGFTVGAEVGSATGNTTGYLLETCPNLKQLIIADDWRAIPEATNRQWQQGDMEWVFRKKFGKDRRIKILKGLSWEVAGQVEDGSLDFAFIDASHDEESVKKDLQAWILKVKADGIICGHDLHFKGVVRALQEFLPMYQVAGVDNCWWVSMHDYALYCSY